MKIKKESFKKALDAVKPGLANREIIEQTTSFVFLNGSIITYNDEISINQPIEGFDDVTGAIKAEEMYNFLNKVKSDEITITLEENEIQMKAGRAKVGFALKSKISLPLEEEIGEITEWKKLPKEFLKAVKFAIPCTSDNMANPKLTCIAFEKKRVLATDNYRIVEYRLKKRMPFKSTLIPASSMRDVYKVEPDMVSEGLGWIHFKNSKEGTIISCRVFNESFVSVDEILTMDYGDGFVFTFPESTSEVLDKADVFTKTQKGMDETNVMISFDSKRLQVECKSDTAWFKEPIRVKGYKVEFEFNIAPYLLKDILKDIDTCMVFENVLKFEGETWTYLTTLSQTN